MARVPFSKSQSVGPIDVYTSTSSQDVAQPIAAVHGAVSVVGRDAREPLTGADHIVRALADLGVETFFGVPGGPIMPLFDAILRAGKRLVESRHETHAAFAAAGYYRATGKVPAVLVTSGPGATNVVTGVASAHLEQVPMLIVCGDVAWGSSGVRMLQSLGPEGVGIDSMLAGVVRAAVRVSLPSSAASQATTALRAATAPHNPGPALLVLPADRGGPPAPEMRIANAEPSLTYQLDDRLVVDVAALLAGARHPLVLVGAACRAQAGKVRALIDALGVPFATTPRAKGLVSEDHPCSLRNAGMAASWWARRYMTEGVDVALVLGTDLDDVSVGPTPPIGPNGILIHVDRDPSVFNRGVRTHTGVICDLGLFAERLTEVVGPGPHNLNGATALARATRESAFDCTTFREDDAPQIAPHRAIHDLQAAAGPGTTFVTDIGEHMLFCLHYLTAREPEDFVIHLGLGSMASGICSAVGLALGNRSRRVVCVCGDGGMQMAGGELLVAMKLGLPIVYAVFNDARYNMVYHGYKQQFGREGSWDTPWMDFVGWAASMGIPGQRIERPGQLTAALLDDLTSRGLPVVLDIRHDAAVRIRGAGRVEALQQMSAGER